MKKLYTQHILSSPARLKKSYTKKKKRNGVLSLNPRKASTRKHFTAPYNILEIAGAVVGSRSTPGDGRAGRSARLARVHRPTCAPSCKQASERALLSGVLRTRTTAPLRCWKTLSRRRSSPSRGDIITCRESRPFVTR